MRKLLLAATVCIIPLQAHAVIPVTDATLIIGQVRSFAQDLKSYAQQLKSYLTQLRQVQEEISSAMSLATMTKNFVQNPSLGAAMGLMGMAGLDLDLPVNPYALQSLMTGYGGMSSLAGITGKLSALNGLVTGSYSRDTIYECTDDSFACYQSRTRAAANAGYKGALSRMYDSLVQHNAVLNGLRDAVNSDSPKRVMDGTAQATIEGAWTGNQNTQALIVNGLAQAQRDITLQQTVEELHRDAREYLASPR